MYSAKEVIKITGIIFFVHVLASSNICIRNANCVASAPLSAVYLDLLTVALNETF